MKKILMLGGAQAQLSAIKKAREMGHTVIVCDRHRQNPGQYMAHDYYPISTTDKEAVMQLAQQLSIDGIMCYAADSGAPTVAYVAKELGLAGNPETAVAVLTNKERFRAFQQQAGLPTPKAKGYGTFEEAAADIENFVFPIMIKPVDAGGSKGVAKLEDPAELAARVEEALLHSKVKRFLLEEYIDSPFPHIGGDGFSVDGRLLFCSLSNEYFSTGRPNPFVSILATWPSILPARLQKKVQQEIQKCITLLDMRTGAYNFDIRIGHDEQVYLIEVAPRNGGSWNPETINYATGVDLIRYSIRAALGEDCRDLEPAEVEGYWASFVLHSAKTGRLQGVQIEPIFQPHVIEQEWDLQLGDTVCDLSGPQDKLGTMILRFDSAREMQAYMVNHSQWVKLQVYEEGQRWHKQLT